MFTVDLPDLAFALVGALQISDRHRTDHEVHYVPVTRPLVRRPHPRPGASRARLRRGPGPGSRGRTLFGGQGQGRAELVGRRPEPSLLLLRDLRELYMKAAGVSIDWEMLAQAAQGAKQRELLALAQRCHPDTLRQMRLGEQQAQDLLDAGADQLMNDDRRALALTR